MRTFVAKGRCTPRPLNISSKIPAERKSKSQTVRPENDAKKATFSGLRFIWISKAFIVALSLPNRPSLNPFLVLLSLKNRVHIDSRCMDVIRIERAELHELLGLRNYVLGCRRHHGIKIPCCLPVNQISPAVALPRLDKREVPAYPALHHILSSIKLTRLFPLRHHCSESGRRIKRRNPRSARANPFRKGPLRIQLQSQPPPCH